MRALRLDGITRTFGGLVAVDDVTLSFREGEIAAVVGPNGAGKSTLIQIVTGFVRPSRGTVRLGEDDVTRWAPEAISAAGVARTFQTSRVFPALTVFDSVMMGVQGELIGFHGTRRRRGVLSEIASVVLRRKAYRERLAALEARAEETLKLFGERLWPRRDQPAFSLSYANRRRLEIARALVAEPDFLLLDEPTAGMNPTETAELTELVAELHARRPHLSILLVEHKLDVVRRLASRVVVMTQGRVIVEETPEEALSEPRVIEAYLGTGAAEHDEAAVHA